MTTPTSSSHTSLSHLVGHIERLQSEKASLRDEIIELRTISDSVADASSMPAIELRNEKLHLEELVAQLQADLVRHQSLHRFCFLTQCLYHFSALKLWIATQRALMDPLLATVAQNRVIANSLLTYTAVCI